MARQTLLNRVPGVLHDIDTTSTRWSGHPFRRLEMAAGIRRLGEPFAELTYTDVEALRTAAQRHYALPPPRLPIVPDIAVTAANPGGVSGLVTCPTNPTPPGSTPAPR